MKLIISLFVATSLSLGTIAVLETVEIMGKATQVMTR